MTTNIANIKNLFTRAATAKLKAQQAELAAGIESLNKKLNSVFIVNGFGLITKALNESLDQLSTDLDAGKAPTQLSFNVLDALELTDPEKKLMLDVLSSKTGIPLLKQFNIKFLDCETHGIESMEFAILKIFTALLSYSWINSIYLQENYSLELELLALANAKCSPCVHEGVDLGLTSNQLKIVKRMHEAFFFEQNETPACAQGLIDLLVIAEGENLKYRFTDSGTFIVKF